jgi:hypothetical protein
MEGETSESSSHARSVLPCHGGKAEAETRKIENTAGQK